MVDVVGSAPSGDTSSLYAVKKSQDLMKAQGEMAVKLINGAGVNTAQSVSPQAAANPEGTGTIVSKYA
ncbi:MAG: hypothetical protein HQK89_13195 [Nitrospirae bacterium]|nr:hypothetical protein [Nitrospirota bacterium]